MTLEKLLREVDEARWHRYQGFVETMRHVVSYQQDYFDTYAGEKHIRRVIENLDLLMSDASKRQLSGVDLHLLLTAAWLHDVGKILTFDSSQSYEKQRAQHAARGFGFIIRENESFRLDEKEALAVAYIIKGHTLTDLSSLPEKKGVGTGPAIEIRPLAAVLRLADELDIDYNRVPDIVKQLSGITITPKWDIRENIDGIEIQSNTWDIKIYSSPKSFEVLEAISNTVDWISKALTSIRDELRKLGLLYKTVELIVDDIYLKEIRSAERKAPKKEEPIKVEKILCPFTTSECVYKDNLNEKMTFVGMPFSADSVDIYAFGIRPAIEEAGLKAWRADEIPSTGPLFCKICSAIRQSGLVVIDISGANPNVMFELGMATALEKRVILLKNHKYSVPSDLAGFEYVEYRNALELKPALTRIIEQLLGSNRASTSVNSG